MKKLFPLLLCAALLCCLAPASAEGGMGSVDFHTDSGVYTLTLESIETYPKTTVTVSGFVDSCPSCEALLMVEGKQYKNLYFDHSPDGVFTYHFSSSELA